MKLDTTTLTMANSIVTALTGLLLVGVWTHLRHATALLWWFAANIIYAAGIALLANSLSTAAIPLIVAGSILADLAPPLIWIGARVFNRRPTPVAPTLLAILAWLAFDLATAMTPAAQSVGFGGWIVWLSVCAFELWRGRAEQIPARWPLIAVLMVHALVYVGGIFDVLTGSLRYGAVAPINSWFGLILFEGMAYAMASAIFMALLCTERETQRYKHAAHVDALTGIANRGALLEAARRLFERCHQDRAPFALIMFDLDNFKEINDLCGHRAGDDILPAFADTVRGLLRPTDLFGRYGGEEFIVVLPGGGIETARSIAERVRQAFAAAHRFYEGQPIDATVSAGVGEARADMSFEDIVDAADRALYRAKHLGRNRVEQAAWVQRSSDGQDNIIRVA